MKKAEKTKAKTEEISVKKAVSNAAAGALEGLKAFGDTTKAGFDFLKKKEQK